MIKLFLLFIVNLFAVSSLASTQGTKQNIALDQKIRKLEQEEVDALLRNDMAAIEKLWAEDYTVNNPRNEVGRASEGPIRAGIRAYSSFLREIEEILIRGNTVIVMGSETVVPKGPAPDAGQTINRRFTNIWMKKDGKWLLTARHANVICQA
jgi:ketosteroid isomerase-like protein